MCKRQVNDLKPKHYHLLTHLFAKNIIPAYLLTISACFPFNFQHLKSYMPKTVQTLYA